MFGLSNVKKNWCKTNPPVLNIPSTEKLLEVSGSNTSGGSGPCNHLTVNEAARLHRSSTSSDLHPISETSISVRNRKPETGSRLDLWNFLTSAKLTSVSAPSTPLIETHIDSSELLHPNLTTTATVVKSSRFMRKSSSAMMNSEGGLKDLTHPAHSEILKAHSAVTIKLVKTVSEFTQQLSVIEDEHAQQLQLLIETFRKKNAELRKDRPSGSNGLFQAWETLLQEVEVDSAAVCDVANCLSRKVARPISEGTYHRKLEARKIFQHRETLEMTLEKASQRLDKSHQLYEETYQQHVLSPSPLTLAAYIEQHNNYVQDVHACNAMADQFNHHVLPQLVQELEGVYIDLSKTTTTTLQQECEALAERAEIMSKRYSSLAVHCRGVNPLADLAAFTRSLGPIPATSSINNKFTFVPPRNPPNIPSEMKDTSFVLKDELYVDRLSGFSFRTKYDLLKKEVTEIESQIRQLNEGLDSLGRLLQRTVESNLYNKTSELQEEICLKKLDLRVAQLHLAAVKVQRDLYGSRAEIASGSDGVGAVTSGKKFNLPNTGMKTKWMKAIRTLTSSSSSHSVATAASEQPSFSSAATVAASAAAAAATETTTPLNAELEKGSRLYQAVMAVIALRKPGTSGGKPEKQAPELSPILLESRHIFQESTYRKITPCDVCSQILRGHSRQGWKCRLCKINVHGDCRSGVSRCLPKSRLLRRQKSSSELDSSMISDNLPDDDLVSNAEEIDQTYSVLKQAGEMGGGCHRRQHSNSSTSKVPSSENVNDAGSSKYYAPTSSNPESAGNSMGSLGAVNRPTVSRSLYSVPRCNPNSLSVGDRPSFPPSSSAPHSPRRYKLNLRMKSFSLDESGEHFISNRLPRSHAPSTHSASQGSSYSQSPSSPVHNRRLLSARNIRMNSVELPDENEKSQSSASASPCPSPKPSHFVPTNLYVVLFNFKARQADELDLKAGYKVTVIDANDPDWWKGKCLGKIGFFPSKYVAKLAPNEKPLQVTHNLQISETEDGLNKLLRDQV